MGIRFLVLGNEIHPEDGVAVRLIPVLQKKFPTHQFVHFDPNEQIRDEEVWIVDVVKGIERVCVLDEKDVNKLNDFPKTTLHDFDLAFHLKLLMNLGIVKKVHIIAIPYGMSVEDVEDGVCGVIKRVEEDVHD